MRDRNMKNIGIPFGAIVEERQPSESGSVTVLEFGDSEQANARAVDLVFVIDTTGSMSDKIVGLLKTCSRFVEEFASLSLNHRIAIVAFGDLKVPGDKIVKTAFTSKAKVTQKSLRNIPRYAGGGNEGESSLEAIQKALALPFRPNVVKVILLITDEPAHQHYIRADYMVKRLASAEVMTFVISPHLPYFKAMAEDTGGKWYQISKDTDLSELLDKFKGVAEKISRVVSDVYQLGGGSVEEYLRLRPPED